MWLGAWVCLVCTSRWLLHRKWSVQYRCQYFTIHSSISECDRQCETRNAQPEIGTDGSSQTRRNPLVDGYGSGFGLPRVSWSVFWPGLEPNWSVFGVQTRTAGGLPGPVANTSSILEGQKANIYESASMAECHQPVSESTVISGHSRHHRLQPYETPPVRPYKTYPLQPYKTSPLRPYKTSPLWPYETHLSLRPVYATLPPHATLCGARKQTNKQTWCATCDFHSSLLKTLLEWAGKEYYRSLRMAIHR